MSNEQVWKQYPGAKFVQACCACGKFIPTNRKRDVLIEGNPMQVATIKHPGCKKVILYSSHGLRLGR